MSESDRRVIERAYLEFRDLKSSKFYAVVRVAHADGTESVSFNFGRIGTPRTWDERARRVAPATAAAAFAGLVGEKRRKGYADAPWPETLAIPAGGADPLAPPFVAAMPGALPAAGPLLLAGLAIPSGRPIAPGDFGAFPDAPATLWRTDEPVDGVGALWSALAVAFPATGLWPLVVSSDDLTDVLLGPSAASSRTADEILAGIWAECVDDTYGDMTEELSPFNRGFPGLAAATTGASDPAVWASVAAGLEGHLGLVPVVRPADVVAAIGWSGWANYDYDAGELAVVFRAWEERFGAVLIGLEFDVLTFGVSRPARNQGEALAIAAEHMAVSTDNIFQGVGTVRDYARDLVHAGAWGFWWD